MSNKTKRTIILTVKKHPDALTNDNFFTRDDAVVISNARNARNALEMKQAKQVNRKTNQLKRFLAANKALVS